VRFKYIFKYISTVHVLRKKLQHQVMSFSQQDNSKTRFFFERRHNHTQLKIQISNVKTNETSFNQTKQLLNVFFSAKTPAETLENFASNLKTYSMPQRTSQRPYSIYVLAA